MSTKTKHQYKSTLQKKSYRSPKLTHFGTISELTSGGSGLMAEGTDVTNMNKFP